MIRRFAVGAFGLVLLVVVSACTTTPGPASPLPSPAPTATPSSTDVPSGSIPAPTAGSTVPVGATSLTIRVDQGEGTATTTWLLTCDPAGGDHPDPATACQVLTDHAAALEPVRPGVSCTQVFGGPETATITGTFRGKAVSAQLARNNGCEITRWTDLTGLLPVGGAR